MPPVETAAGFTLSHGTPPCGDGKKTVSAAPDTSTAAPQRGMVSPVGEPTPRYPPPTSKSPLPAADTYRDCRRWYPDTPSADSPAYRAGRRGGIHCGGHLGHQAVIHHTTAHGHPQLQHLRQLLIAGAHLRPEVDGDVALCDLPARSRSGSRRRRGTYWSRRTPGYTPGSRSYSRMVTLPVRAAGGVRRRAAPPSDAVAGGPLPPGLPAARNTARHTAPQGSAPTGSPAQRSAASPCCFEWVAAPVTPPASFQNSYGTYRLSGSPLPQPMVVFRQISAAGEPLPFDISSC